MGTRRTEQAGRGAPGRPSGPTDTRQEQDWATNAPAPGLPTTVVCLFPVLRRPQNIDPLITSLEQSVALEDADVTALFLVSADDNVEAEALDQRGLWYERVPWTAGPADYARKINHGLRITTSEWIFTGADDLRFHPGWVRACLNTHIRTGCHLIGTNDLHNPTVISGKYATHLFVHRSYAIRAVVDQPGNMFCDLYSHNCVDTEACDTARARGEYAAAKDAHVEHLHPVFDRRIPHDDVYAKGREHHMGDRRLYMRRRRLWNPTARRALMRPAPAATWPKR